MKTYIHIREGYGEGCDYTIGCNMNWSIIQAENLDDAIERAIGTSPDKMVDEYIADEDFEYDGNDWARYGTREENSFDDLLLYEVADSIDLGPICLQYQKERANRIKKATKKAEENKEREEYKRLKRKFG